MAEEEEIVLLMSEIRGIQLQLRVLEERMRVLVAGDEKLGGFSDLKGIWAGANFSEEEIKEAEIRVKEFPK